MRWIMRLAAIVVAAVMSACGGSGDDANGAANPPTSAQTTITLQSDTGDYIGQGRSYSYTRADASITVLAVSGRLSLNISGDQSWSAVFQLPGSLTQLAPGTWANLARYPFNDAGAGALSWSGEGRGCNTLLGAITVHSATYAAGQLTSVDLSFEQRCEHAEAALRGRVRWFADDTTVPPGPIDPPPAGLWSPAAGTTPDTGSYVYLVSDPGDYVGGGQTRTYTQANAVMNVSVSGRDVSVSIDGNEWWSGNFAGMSSLEQLQPGYYGGLRRYPFHNPIKGGLDWGGEGRGCNTLTGWFTIDSLSFVNGSLASLDLRFEQHCEGASAALRGKIHWVAADMTAPAGPVSPPPVDLWSPAPGATPAAGNYVYLVSDPGDYIGAGQTYTYTPTNSTVVVNADGNQLDVNVAGWTATFAAMNSVVRIQPGYYGSLQRYPFHNPALGGLSWGGQGRGCNTLAGWFVIDSVTYTDGTLSAVDLRFEQHCEGAAAALRGRVHWVG